VFNGLFRDLTDRLAAEEQLRQARRWKRSPAQRRIAHDFNNLLTVIIGNMEELAERMGTARICCPAFRS